MTICVIIHLTCFHYDFISCRITIPVRRCINARHVTYDTISAMQ